MQHSLLCCLASGSGSSEAKRRTEEEEEAGPRLDRVEQAFRRFDIDQDGFLSWSEFKQVSGCHLILMKFDKRKSCEQVLFIST